MSVRDHSVIREVDNRTPQQVLDELEATTRALRLALAHARIIAQNAALELDRLRAEHERDTRRVYAWENRV